MYESLAAKVLCISCVFNLPVYVEYLVCKNGISDNWLEKPIIIGLFNEKREKFVLEISPATRTNTRCVM